MIYPKIICISARTVWPRSNIVSYDISLGETGLLPVMNEEFSDAINETKEAMSSGFPIRFMADMSMS